jgi:hypothetical protein
MEIEFPVVTLTTGLRVANLCAGRAWSFEDRTILPAVKTDRFQRAALSTVERVDPSIKTETGEILASTMTRKRVVPQWLVDEVTEVLEGMKAGTIPIDLLIVEPEMMAAWRSAGRAPDRMRTVIPTQESANRFRVGVFGLE